MTDDTTRGSAAPQRYRKRPAEIEAWQFTYDAIHEIAEWCGGLVQHTRPLSVDGFTIGGHRVIVISTLEGQMTAQPNDWIIRGVQGEFYPCKPDIFAETYEAVDG